MRIIHHTETSSFWQGHISLERTEDWTRAWRLPFQQRALFPPAEIQRVATMPSGVRIAFLSDTRSVSGSLVLLEGDHKLDVCCDGVLCATVALGRADSFRYEGLPAGEKLIELWLPSRGDFRLRILKIDDDATLSPSVDARPKWITYGSSITHCGAEQSPVFAWPAIVAREHNLNLTCLGYAGQCHLDAMIARLIRDRPADYISLCLGINMYGGSLGRRAFLSAIVAFVQIIREKHPRTPILLISPICSPPRETTPSAIGWTLSLMREQVELAYETIRDCGDENIHYLNGVELFGPLDSSSKCKGL